MTDSALNIQRSLMRPGTSLDYYESALQRLFFNKLVEVVFMKNPNERARVEYLLADCKKHFLSLDMSDELEKLLLELGYKVITVLWDDHLPGAYLLNDSRLPHDTCVIFYPFGKADVSDSGHSAGWKVIAWQYG
jgi:hypothetical protein